ncbi:MULTISPECIES: hypothetical protein [unclassified Bradyrhizobium]|uniref:hypothetical protein n=1 Tax=unclassified Bradyrhizobium TaxID=2631580 RepID=UPI001FF7CD5E|nr:MULTISPECIES: hypothetical protein [unclassified Bradyrhizobium]
MPVGDGSTGNHALSVGSDEIKQTFPDGDKESNGMELKPGSRWKSSVCNTEIVVVRPPKTPAILECGGHPMVANGATRPEGLALSLTHSAGSAMGKRFFDERTGLEVLCVKAGCGSLSIDGHAIDARETKKLPSSD